MQGLGQVLDLSLPLQIQEDQRLANRQKHGQPHQGDQTTGDELKAEGAPHALLVPGSVELRGKDARPGHRAEHAEVEHKQQLIHNGHAAHLQCAHPTDHNVVQHTDKICNGILDHDRHGHCQHHRVKFPISNEFLSHTHLNS